MSTRNILFVDDEQYILDGLKRMLRPLRKEFTIHFAINAQVALGLMTEHNFDVIFSDMRMPGIDGATFLKQAQEQYPQAIRILLTGQAEEDSIMKTVGVAHRLLAKPFDSEELKNVIRQASALHNLVASEEVRKIVSQIDSLPSVPEMYMKLQKILKDPQSTIEDIAHVIESDIAMTAKVLQLVNSSFFGVSQTVETTSRAVMLLGLETITTLTLVTQAFSEYSSTGSDFSIEKLWKHSLLVGSCAKQIASTVSEDKELIENSLTAGVLHDIGVLILGTQMSAEYNDVIEESKTAEITLQEAEKKLLGVSHCEIGAYLVGLWGLPSPIAEAVGFHHNLEDIPTTAFTPALAVHIADSLLYTVNPESNIGINSPLNTEMIKELGYDNFIEEWEEICFTIWEQSKDE